MLQQDIQIQFLGLILNAFGEENKINVFTPDVGGGFGMKIFNYPEYVLTLAAAKITNKTIKWTAKRTESFLSDIHGRDHLSKATIGIDENYKFKGLIGLLG